MCNWLSLKYCRPILIVQMSRLQPLLKLVSRLRQEDFLNCCRPTKIIKFKYSNQPMIFTQKHSCCYGLFKRVVADGLQGALEL